MNKDPKYKVMPHEPVYKNASLTEYERNNVEGLNSGVGVILWIAIVAFLGFSAEGGFTIATIVSSVALASVALAIIVLLMKTYKVSELQRQKTKEANQSENRRVIDEAESLTSSLTRNYNSSKEHVDDLPQHLIQASKYLIKAESEYESNAFAPFWDAVEDAAQCLAVFNDKAKELSENADQYYRKLDDRKHTFPVFPVQLRTIPDASEEVKELRRIVRMGQTNYQFANIWEHRRTREVLIAGFRTLGEVVNNLGATIEGSIYDLRRSVSSDLAKVVEEQITTRETLDKRLLEQNRVLDNIQHHRKPAITDHPSKY